MSSSTPTQLISSPFRLATSKDKQPSLLHHDFSLNQTEKTVLSSASNDVFPIAHLPYELRQLIYIHYFASLPIQDITCSNARLPHHSLTPLATSSPFLVYDHSSALYYRHTTFNFSCPEALKTFSKSLSSDRRNGVRKVKIMYGRYDQPSRDWVYLLTSNFLSLEGITFSLNREKGRLCVGHRCFENWWGCVRDTVRETLTGNRAVRLTVEDGELGVVDIVKAQKKA